MGALRSWREPAVLVLLVLVALRQLLAIGFALAAQARGLDADALAGYAAAGGAAEPVALVLLVALIVACHAGPTRRAHVLTVLGLVVVAVAVLVQLVAAVLGLIAARQQEPVPSFVLLSVARSLFDLVVPVLAVVTLAVLLQRPAAGFDLVDQQPALPPATDDQAVEAEVDPELQPTWRVDEAAGAVWLSAGDAASGRAPTAAGPVEEEEPHPWASGPR